MLRTPALVLGAVAGLFAAAAPAAANEDSVPRRQTMARYGDLDLSTEAGRNVLDRRLRLAALRVCHDGGARRIDDLSARCRADAISNARRYVATRSSAVRLAMGD